MEEADLDELEWMACQQFPPEEDEDYYDGYEEMPPPPEHPPETDRIDESFSHDDSSRKRPWYVEDSHDRESSGNAAVKKHRGLLSDPAGTSSKKSLFIPGTVLNPPTQNTVSLRTSPATFTKGSPIPCTEGQPLASVLAADPWTLRPPPATEEVCHMSPRNQEEEYIEVPEVPTSCKLPRRCVTDIDGDFIPITGLDGDRVYSAKVEPVKANYNLTALHNKDLLGEPIAKMIERIERESFEQVIAASDKKMLSADTIGTVPASEHEDLWVDKYAPRSFTELLSDEKTNREVLRWLKQWDPCVFGSKRYSTSEEVLTSLRRQATHLHGNVNMGGRGSFNNNVNKSMAYRNDTFNSDSTRKVATEEKSTLDRPEEKVLLLCGPPGLGKTTLAHVAARHCGYRVVEINASDDRVATTLQGKILDAIQMKSVTGDNRPNCLVIDEIDGALSGAEGKGAIDSLLEIINADKKSSLGKENEMQEGVTKVSSKKTGGSAVRRLSRPVICICNDFYAPALRKLRQVARVHVFVQPSVSRVVSRLKYICGKEGFKTNARALSALASHTECDIRSCLNTCQFLNRKKQNLKTLDVGSQVVGRKDMTSSIFDIWGEIFHKRKVRAGSGMRGLVEMPEIGNQDHKEFVRRYGLFSNHGDYDLTMSGIHENILHMRYLDPSLEKTVEALEWMGDSEIFSHHIIAKQQFHLLAYQPLPMIAIRGLVAQQERPQVQWPKQHQNSRTEQAVKMEMLNSWLGSMTASISRALSPVCLGLDIVTPLLTIITPPTIRPVATQLLTSKEKDEIVQLVDTMLGFGLSYRHPKAGMLKADHGIDGHSSLTLDPPIDTLVKYKEFTAGYRQLSSTLCQMLAHEVEIERIRREGALRENKMIAVNPTPKLTIDAPNKKDEERGKPPLQLVEDPLQPCDEKIEVPKKMCYISSSKKSVPEQEKPQPRRSMNFFERFKKSTQTDVTADVKAKEKLATLQRDSRPLLYKYHEGLTNAVKRPMFVRDFL
ncbi:uncharacterized protein [Physcomitrium patens]|uniref:AAA+ ATPase domain-containing protein n=1 Tax=Physcomitrium patens TaxID=3218 RepID=A0A7I4E7D8_PHYPA|nr:chromosome transmission fidelity protein 18 homolog isoform X2 [Physcomitrium patens]|eukprot:XP_024380878.1 chromosome transmission fidelity protein 18 homolog isoform X2 [Physcomitrella patens]